MTQSGYQLRPRSSGGDLSPASRSELTDFVDPYRYGYRWGEEPGEMIPLTYADLLDPREGDHVSDDNLNSDLADYFKYFLRCQFEDEDGVLISSNFKLRFGEKGKGPAPDAFVIRGVRDPERHRGSFWIGHEPGELVLTVEIVSRGYKNKDYKDSKKIYQQRKVPEYILIELQGLYLTGPYKLTCYRLDAHGVYQEIERDEKGGIASEQANLRIVPDPEGWGLEVTDLRTGERLLSPPEENAARKAAEQRAEQEAEARRTEAEARRAAEQQAKLEAEARRAAEQQAEQEVKARRAAEQQVEQGLRRNVEDLCFALGVEWSATRKAAVEIMSSSQLEVLRGHLVSDKSWPKS